MCRIPFTVRTKGRYAFRRRIHFRNIISKPLTMALQTADPGIARTRAPMLAARFAFVKAELGKVVGYERTLTGEEIEAIFRHKLHQELSFWMTSAYEDEAWSSSVPEVALQPQEAYRFLSHPESRYGVINTNDGTVWEPENGVSRDTVDEISRDIRSHLSDEAVAQTLGALGIAAHESNIGAARKHMFRAGAVAGAKAQRPFDDDVMAAPDPFQALTSDLPAVSDAVSKLMAIGSSRTACRAVSRLSERIESILSSICSTINRARARSKRRGVDLVSLNNGTIIDREFPSSRDPAAADEMEARRKGSELALKLIAGGDPVLSTLIDCIGLGARGKTLRVTLSVDLVELANMRRCLKRRAKSVCHALSSGGKINASRLSELAL